MVKTVDIIQMYVKYKQEQIPSIIQPNTVLVMLLIKPPTMSKYQQDSNVLVEQLSNKNIRKKI